MILLPRKTPFADAHNTTNKRLALSKNEKEEVDFKRRNAIKNIKYGISLSLTILVISKTPRLRRKHPNITKANP